MKFFFITIVIYFSLSSSIFAHDLPRKSIFGDYARRFNFNSRLNLGIELSVDRFYFEWHVLTVNFIKEENHQIKVSSNYLVPLVLLAGKTINFDPLDFVGIPLLVVSALTNFRLNYYLNNNLAITTGQSSDIYLLYKPTKIYTESSIGLKFIYDFAMAKIELKKPWTMGFNKDLKPYISFGIGIEAHKLNI